MQPEDKTPLTTIDIKILSNWIDQGLKWEQSPAISHKRPMEMKKPGLPPGPENPVDRLLAPYFKSTDFVPRPR